MVEHAIFTLLTGDTEVGSLVSTRVYPVQIPPMKPGDTLASTRPAIVYQRISGPRGYTTNGQDPLANARYQITCWALTPTAARELADKVRKRMSGAKETAASVVIRGVFLEDEGDIPSTEPNEQQAEFGRRLDFTIWHVETVPDLA